MVQKKPKAANADRKAKKSQIIEIRPSRHSQVDSLCSLRFLAVNSASRADPEVRLRCANALLLKSPAWFESLLFSDGKMIHRAARSGFDLCFLDKHSASVDFRTGHAKVHVWGCIGINFRLLLFLNLDEQNGRQTGASYRDACLKKLVQVLSRQQRLSSSVLQFDGSRTNRSEPALRYLDGVGLQYVPDWPPRSPDLSPLENIWAMLQRAVDARTFSNAHRLRQFIRHWWDKLDQTMLNSMVQSFSGRLQRVVEQRGEAIMPNDRGQE